MVQYSTVWYGTVVMLKNSFQFIIPRNPLKIRKPKYSTVCLCTKGVRGQKVARVSEDYRYQGCQSLKGAKAPRVSGEKRCQGSKAQKVYLRAGSSQELISDRA